MKEAPDLGAPGASRSIGGTPSGATLPDLVNIQKTMEIHHFNG